jgi:hypothetical protein
VSIKVEKRELGIEYIIEFGDSQHPERFRFTEPEAKLLLKKLQVAIYGEPNFP